MPPKRYAPKRTTRKPVTRKRYVRKYPTRVRKWKPRLQRTTKPEWKVTRESISLGELTVYGPSPIALPVFTHSFQYANTMVVASGPTGRVGNKINVPILKWKIHADLNDNLVTSLFFRTILLQSKGGHSADSLVNPSIIDILASSNYDNLCISRFLEGISSKWNILYDRVNHMSNCSSRSALTKKLSYKISDLKWLQKPGGTTDYYNVCDNPVFGFIIINMPFPEANPNFLPYIQIRTEYALVYQDS